MYQTTVREILNCLPSNLKGSDQNYLVEYHEPRKKCEFYLYNGDKGLEELINIFGEMHLKGLMFSGDGSGGTQIYLNAYSLDF